MAPVRRKVDQAQARMPGSGPYVIKRAIQVKYRKPYKTGPGGLGVRDRENLVERVKRNEDALDGLDNMQLARLVHALLNTRRMDAAERAE
jgi:hypothetical protein